MKIRRTGILLVAMSVAPLANAVLVQSTTGNAVTFHECIAGANTSCDDNGPAVMRVYGGYPGALTAAASLDDASYGVASSSSRLSGDAGAPILGVLAESDPGVRANTSSGALQRYTYAGTSATTRTFSASLTYVTSIPAANANCDLTGAPAGCWSGVGAYIEVFTIPGNMLDVGTTPQSNFAAIFGGYESAPGYTSLGFDFFSDLASNPAGIADLDVSISLNPGQSIWVAAWLQTPAANGATVDAAHTMTTAFDDSTNLVPANVAPEPGTALLLTFAVAALRLAGKYGRTAAGSTPAVLTDT